MSRLTIFVGLAAATLVVILTAAACPERDAASPVGSPRPSDTGAPPSFVAGSPPPSAAPPSVDLVSRVLKRISQQGRVLYNPPTEMRLGQNEIVELRITRDEVTDLTKDLSGRGAPVQEQLPVADAMLVELLGPDFDIAPLSPRRQLIGGRPFNEWAWRIQPQRAGTTFLRLSVSIEIPKTKKVEGLSPVVLKRQIEIQVDPLYVVSQFVGRNWGALLTALIALVGLLWGPGLLARRKEGREGV